MTRTRSVLRALITVWALVTGLGLPILSVSAEYDSERTWYTVEIVVFTQPQDGAGEVWPLQPSLGYAQPLAELKSSPTMRDATVSLPGYRLEDTTPKPVLTYDPSAAFTPVIATQPDAADTDSMDAAAVDAAAVGTVAVSNAAVNAATHSPLMVPTALAMLSTAGSDLAAQARRIDRSRGRNVVFHKRWQQPFWSESETLPLLIDSNPVTGDYPQLQGTLKLYISRFLHLEADLWLNRRSADMPDRWRMPAPPLAPPAVTLRPVLFALTGKDLSDYSQRMRILNTTSHSPIPQPAYQSVSLAGSETQMNALEPTLVAMPAPAAAPEPLSAYAPWRHAVKIEQRRKMRSDELHYLDHPLLGILIKITELEFSPFVATAEGIEQ